VVRWLKFSNVSAHFWHLYSKIGMAHRSVRVSHPSSSNPPCLIPAAPKGFGGLFVILGESRPIFQIESDTSQNQFISKSALRFPPARLWFADIRGSLVRPPSDTFFGEAQTGGGMCGRFRLDLCQIEEGDNGPEVEEIAIWLGDRKTGNGAQL
jgi:hypothetical protein